MSDAHVPDGVSLESLVAEVADEFLARRKRGERPDVEEYARRYPRFAEVLCQVLSSLELMRLSSGSGAAGPAQEDREPPGLLGDFRILREVGRGGMGVVYEARQLSLDRRVALKVLPFAAALDPRQLQRFKNEAQAAAHLHHTNIVPVFGVGCERGAHFYAMQFIEGRTLAEVIGDLRLGSRPTPAATHHEDVPRPPETVPPPDTRPVAGLSTERSARRPEFFRTVARLGLQAAEALEYAHQEGIVHRDIKPANLLLDARDNLWITDFGLARLQHETGLSVSGDLLGTLRYMSPEQALGHPAAVDHRTDVYSLGATLYELLTSCPVFEGRDRQGLLRRIASEEPRAPRRLNAAVPVELEIIVQKALVKEPGGRYATAQELADDLRRFLQDEPIRARRPSWLERARKWAVRHRPAVWSAAAALLVTVVVLAASVGWVARDRAARRARLTAEIQTALEEAQRFRREGKWPQALAAANRAEALLRDGSPDPALVEQVQGLLRALAEEEADGRLVARLEAIRLLQAGVSGRENRFALERALPEYRQAFGSYGLRAEMMAPAEAAALIRRRPAPIRGTLVAALDHWLDLARHENAPEAGWLEQVLAEADADPWRRRLRAARRRPNRQALEKLAREVDVASQPPQALFLLDRALHASGARDEAVTLLRRAQEAFPGDFWTNQNLGTSLAQCRPPQLDEAIRFQTAAVALRPESPGARLNLGLVLWKKGRLGEAADAFRRAVALKPDYAEAHSGLGVILWKQRRLGEAVPVLRRACTLQPDSAYAHCNLGSALLDARRFDEAIPVLRRAVRLKPSLPAAHFNLGYALKARGRFPEAAAAYRRAIALEPAWAQAHCNLGNALLRQGRTDEALAAYSRALGLKPDLVEGYPNLALALSRKGQIDEAVAALRKAIALKPDWATPHYDLGNALVKQGRREEAAVAYRQAIALKPDYAEAYCNLGSLLRRRGEYAQALTAFKRGHELGSQRKDWQSPSARWVEECRHLVELDGRAQSVLQGKAQPGSARERNEFAQLCYHKGHHAAAARFWADAFTAYPGLAADLDAGHRYDAACAAALAAAGQGADASRLDDRERARWRKQAVEWLRADLALRARRLKAGAPEERGEMAWRLRYWQQDSELASLRDPAAVARLPADERAACNQLWAEVAVLLRQADAAQQPDHRPE